MMFRFALTLVTLIALPWAEMRISMSFTTNNLSSFFLKPLRMLVLLEYNHLCRYLVASKSHFTEVNHPSFRFHGGEHSMDVNIIYPCGMEIFALSYTKRSLS